MCVFDDNPEPESCSPGCTEPACIAQAELDIGESTLPPDPHISFKYFDKYSHNATKLVIC